MESGVKQQSRTLSDQVGAELMYQLVYGKYRDGKRLPPETEIAKDLGVSRNVVRNSMSVLEQEGYISCRRGVGTIVNQHVLNIQTRIDLADKFQSLIESTGCKAACSYFSIWQTSCSEELAAKLRRRPGDPLLCISRVMTADGVPAVYCRDFVPTDLIQQLPPEVYERAAEESTFALLEEAGNPETLMAVSDVMAVAADDTLCRLCGLQPREPVLHLEAVQYTFDGNALFLSKEYYMNALHRQTIVRKKIYTTKEAGHGDGISK